MASLLVVFIFNLTSIKCEPLVNDVSRIVGMDGIAVVVQSEYKAMYFGNTAVLANTSYRNGKYVITLFYSDYFKPRTLEDIRSVLIHELIHVWQIYQERLVLLDYNRVVWKGDTVDLRAVSYEDRGFEIEAKKLEQIVLLKLK